MNVRPDIATPRLIDDCFAGAVLLDPASARAKILDRAPEISGQESKPLADLVGRIAADDTRSVGCLPRFDNSAVDGYGLHAADLDKLVPLTLPIAGRAAAGGEACHELRPGATLRVLTGARIPNGVAAVVLEERTTRTPTHVTFHMLPEVGANIRRQGEDVAPGTVVVSKGTALDARHLAILAASGHARLEVKRRLRIGVLSSGDELVEAGDIVGHSAINDTNRPMLLSLLTSPTLEVVDLGTVADDAAAVASALSRAASHLDLLLTSGGVSGSDADHLHGAIVASGGRCETLKLALRPGKPIAIGSIGNMQVLALPGNPVAALVNFLLFGRPLIRKLLRAAETTALSSVARAAEAIMHKPGRTEFMPAKIIECGSDGMPLIRTLGRGGSARLLPLVTSDGFVEIGPDSGQVQRGEILRFHPFTTAFAL